MNGRPPPPTAVLATVGLACIVAGMLEAWALRGRVGAAVDAYDRVATARRIGRRLDAAMLQLPPSGWRLAQLCALAPTVLLLQMVSAGWSGVMLAIGVVRVGSTAVLAALSGRRSAAEARAAPVLAGRLGGELAAGSAPAQALMRVARSGDPDLECLHRVLESASARAHLGAEPGAALRAAAESSLIRRAADLFAVSSRGGGAAPLMRLARALEDERCARLRLGSSLAEPRMASRAVPLLAGATALSIGVHGPVAAPVLVAGIAGAGLVAMGTLAVHRLTRQP